MRGRRALALAGAAVLAGCGGGGGSGTAGGAPASPPVSGTGSLSAAAAVSPGGGPGPSGPGWVDPEPAGAQGLAEQVLSAPWNQDKVTQLTMGITTIESHTTGLQGFQTGLAAAGSSLDERLSRLGAEVSGTEVRIRLPGSVLFDFDSAQIRPDAQRTLNEVAEVVKGYARRPVRVEGHTDSVASDDYNQKLSERRAEAVRAWLAAKGIEPSRLQTRGFGESKPVADNATPEGRQKNRRVEVIIEKGT